MTPIESIYEIKAKLHDIQSYLHVKNAWVAKTAQNKYEQLVARFFKEHGCVEPEQRSKCLHDYDYFLSLWNRQESLSLPPREFAMIE